MIKRIAILTAAAATVLALGAATPALADGGPVNVSASIPSTVTLTGLTGTINFGTATPGQTDTVMHAEQYTVSSNSPTGFNVQIAPQSGSFLGNSGGASLPNSDLSVTENTSASGGGSFNAANPLLIDSTSGPGNKSYDENWAFAPPASAPASSYAETFQYAAVSN